MSEILLSLEDSQRLIKAQHAINEAQKIVDSDQIRLQLSNAGLVITQKEQRIALLELAKKYEFNPNITKVAVSPEGLVTVQKDSVITSNLEPADFKE